MFRNTGAECESTIPEVGTWVLINERWKLKKFWLAFFWFYDFFSNLEDFKSKQLNQTAVWIWTRKLHFKTINVLNVVWMWPFAVHQDFPFPCDSTSPVFTTTLLYRECRKLCYIYIVTLVLAVPVLKHGPLILSNKSRSSLPTRYSTAHLGDRLSGQL